MLQNCRPSQAPRLACTAELRTWRPLGGSLIWQLQVSGDHLTAQVLEQNSSRISAASSVDPGEGKPTLSAASPDQLHAADAIQHRVAKKSSYLGDTVGWTQQQKGLLMLLQLQGHSNQRAVR